MTKKKKSNPDWPKKTCELTIFTIDEWNYDGIHGICC